MICKKCGTQNDDMSKFCIKCGNNMFENQIGPNEQTYQKQPVNNDNYNSKISTSEYFFIILAVILKPFSSLKEELNKFNIVKNSVVLSLLVSLIATLITLIRTMFTSVRVKSYWSSEVNWVFENLKEINYIKVVGINFLIYLGIIILIACIYYIGSLIIKKQTSFSRLLGISAISIVPAIICFSILSPLLSIIYAPLGTIITIIGVVYATIIIYEAINNEILLEKDSKFYFNLVCLSIIFIVIYYLYTKAFISSQNSINSILNMFDY